MNLACAVNGWWCRRSVIDLFHAATIEHKKKTFCTSSLAVKNLKTSLDVHKQSFLFSGDSTWPPRDKGLWPLELDRIDELFISCFQARPHGQNQPCSTYVPRGGHFISYLPYCACLGDIQTNQKLSFEHIPSFSSKRGHVKKKHVFIGYQTWHVWPPNIRSLTAVKLAFLSA